MNATNATPIALEILNTGRGHLRLTFDPGEPQEVAKAKHTISLLLRRGFALFIQRGRHTIRVRDFDPEHGSYYVDAVPDEAQADTAKPDAPRGGICTCGKRLHHRGRCLGPLKRRKIPAAGTSVVAVGRTAGG